MDLKEANLLSMSFLELARQTLQRCTRRKGQEPIKDIPGVYILVAASLESFINEVCLEAIYTGRGTADDRSALEEIIYGDNGKGLELRDKWQTVIGLLQNRKFDRSRRPWQDFEILIRLRNALLHYKSEYVEPEYVPKYLRSLLASKKLLPDKGQKTKVMTLSELFESYTHWIDKISTVRLGIWAYNTGVSMIHEFLNASDEPTKREYEDLMELHKIDRVIEDPDGIIKSRSG